VDAASPEASRPGPGYSRAAPNGRGVSPRADQRDRRLTRLTRFVQHLAAPRCSRVPGCAVGADQLDPPDEVEPPGPAPRRHADHPKRTAPARARTGPAAARGVVRTDADGRRSEVPDQRSGARAQHAADLGQACGGGRPRVHRQRADDQVERSVGGTPARPRRRPETTAGASRRCPDGRRWRGRAGSWRDPGRARSGPGRAGGPAGSTDGRARTLPPAPARRRGSYGDVGDDGSEE
jgi:hypothetical protein